MTRTYTELIRLGTLEERFEYLVLRGEVGSPTFGSERWVNQEFYHSHEWATMRDHVILRDNSCDLAVEEFPIPQRPHVHHMNPMTVDEIVDGNPVILDPEFLILTSHRTHNAIHYGDASLLPKLLVERRPGDTSPWRVPRER